MVWCSNCTRIQPVQSDRSSLVCCHGCGKVVNQETDSKKRSFSGVAMGQHEQGVNNLIVGKRLKMDMAIFRALQTTVRKNAKGAIISRKNSDDSESLSDIDDSEVRSYLLKEDAVLLKKMMWERSNAEYTKGEAARKAAAANAMKLKKEKQQMQAAGTKKTRGVAVKRTSTRVNYDALNELLGEPEASEKSKKSRTDSYSEDDTALNQNKSGQNKFSAWEEVEDEDYDEENNDKYQNDPYDDYGEGQHYDDDDLF